MFKIDFKSIEINKKISRCFKLEYLPLVLFIVLILFFMLSIVVNQLYDFSSTSSISANYQLYGKYETQIFGVKQAYYKEGNTCFDLSLNSNSMEYKVDKRIYYKLSYVNDESESIPIDDGYWENKTVCTPSIDDTFACTFKGYYVHTRKSWLMIRVQRR